MSKPKGGRGKKVPYTSVTVRIPEDLKDTVESLVEDYRQFILDGIDSQESEVMPLADAIELSKKLLRSKTAKSDTVGKLLTAIYKTEVTKQDLE